MQLERLAAQRVLYTRAKCIFLTHAILATVVAGALSFVSQSHSEVRAYAALFGVVLAIVDVGWLNPWQKTLRETAARIQESFDCAVLGLAWHADKVGTTVDHETVVECAQRYRQKEPSFRSLLDWYPVDVCRIPLPLACVVCQRTNAWWDGMQRRRYARVLLGAVGILLAGLLAVGVMKRMTVSDLLLTTVVPLASAITLALRQYKENSEAAARLDSLKDRADRLWTRALGGAAEAELAGPCRALQDDLFDSRRSNTPVFDWIYWRLRAGHEFQMQEVAAKLVRDLEVARGRDV